MGTPPPLTPLEAAAEAWALRPYRSLNFDEQRWAREIVRDVVEAAFAAYGIQLSESE